MIGTLQWKQRGASTWIAHWSESKTCVVPPIFSSNALSYALPQHSQFFMAMVAFASRAPGVTERLEYALLYPCT